MAIDELGHNNDGSGTIDMLTVCINYNYDNHSTQENNELANSCGN